MLTGHVASLEAGGLEVLGGDESDVELVAGGHVVVDHAGAAELPCLGARCGAAVADLEEARLAVRVRLELKFKKVNLAYRKATGRYKSIHNLE